MTKTIIRTKHSINAQDELGLTALHRTISDNEFQTEAAKRNHIRNLIKRGANVAIRDGWGDVPLHYASSFGYVTIAEELINANKLLINEANIFGTTPLHKAAAANQAGMVDFLLRNGADPNLLNGEDIGKTACALAIEGKAAPAVIQRLQSLTNPKLAKRAKQQFSRSHARNVNHTVDNEDVVCEIKTKFLTAAVHGDLHTVKKLYELHHDHIPLLSCDNAAGNTPLHLAMISKNTELVDYLLAQGADMYRLNDVHETAFQLACYQVKKNPRRENDMDMKRFIEMASIFAQHQFNFNHTDGQLHSYLHIFVTTNFLDPLVFLLKSGVNLNIKDQHGYTPLHDACVLGWSQYKSSAENEQINKEHYQIINALLENGADVQLKTRKGATPYDLAKYKLNDQLMSLLKKHADKQAIETTNATTLQHTVETAFGFFQNSINSPEKLSYDPPKP